MDHKHFIQQLDGQPNTARRALIGEWLAARGVGCTTQAYPTGTNLFVDLGTAEKRVGIGSHFDRVMRSAGANDNGSAVAVCLNLIERFLAAGRTDLGLRVFFFDEEETGLKGSEAYVRMYGIHDLMGLINLELVGMGDQLALWPVNAAKKGMLLEAFEGVAARQGIGCHRFDRIVTNTADHVSFQRAGLADAFTVTCISELDKRQAAQYYAALAAGAGHEKLMGILSQAPLFQHYHQPTDTFDRLQEASMEMTAHVIWETVVGMFASS